MKINHCLCTQNSPCSSTSKHNTNQHQRGVQSNRKRTKISASQGHPPSPPLICYAGTEVNFFTAIQSSNNTLGVFTLSTRSVLLIFSKAMRRTKLSVLPEQQTDTSLQCRAAVLLQRCFVVVSVHVVFFFQQNIFAFVTEESFSVDGHV